MPTPNVEAKLTTLAGRSITDADWQAMYEQVEPMRNRCARVLGTPLQTDLSNKMHAILDAALAANPT